MPGAGDTATINNGATPTIGEDSVTLAGLTLNPGNVAGTSSIAVTGTMTWNGGTVYPTLTLPSGATLNLSGGTVAGTVNNRGTTNWNAGRVGIANGGVFNNAGTFNARAQADWINVGGGAVDTPAFNNTGVFNEVNPTPYGTSYFQPWINFNNTGTVNATAGTLQLTDGTSTGVFNATTGGIAWVGGTHTLTGGARCTGSGRSRVTGGTVRILNWVVGGTAGGTFALNGGTLKGAPGTITGTLTLLGGTISGALTNTGTTTWVAGRIHLPAGTVVRNSGTFVSQASSDWINSGGTGATPAFNNTGVFNEANPAAGGTSYFQPWINFNNTGTVNATAGTLQLTDGTSTGVFNATTGGIAWVGGTHTLTGGARCTGSGRSQVAGGIVRILNSVVGGANGGTFALNGGTLHGAPGTITGTLTLLGGAITGTLTNAGVTTWAAAGGRISILRGSVFRNTGTFVSQATSDWINAGGTGATPAFNNIGVFNEANTAPSGASYFQPAINFNNTGTVNATAGALHLTDGTSTGTFNATTGTVAWVGGTHTLTGARFTGSGMSQVTSGTVRIMSSVVGGVSGGTFALNGGTLNGAPGTITGTLTLLGGAISGALTNTGTTTWVSGRIHLPGGTTFSNRGTFVSKASSDWINSGGTGATPAFNNTGIFNEANPAAGGTSYFQPWINFNNTGTVNATAGALHLTDGTSSGVFNATTGTIAWVGGTHTLTGSARCTGAGMSQVTSGTVRILGSVVGGASGGTFALNGGRIAGGPGTITGTLTLLGGTIAGTLTNTGVTTWAAGRVHLPAGTLFNNQGTFVSKASSDWINSGGTGATPVFNNTGVFTEANPAAGGTSYFQPAINFNNAGTVNATSGTLQLTDGTSTGAFNATTGGIAWVAGTHTLTGARCTGSGRSQVTGGTVRISGPVVGGVGGGTFALNGGTLNGAPGTITGTLTLLGGAVSGTLTNTGVTTWAAGRVHANAGAVFTNTGTFLALAQADWITNGGTGQAFRNYGTLRLRGPGASTIGVPFAQSGSGVLEVKIRGASAGSGFDQLYLGAGGTLGGTLRAGLVSPFKPTAGSVFPVVAFPTNGVGSTRFQTVTAPGLRVGYTSTAVNLTALGSAAPAITGFSPTHGAAGTSVAINGSGFTGATRVTFGGAAAQFAVNSAARITATVPSAAASGPVSVTTPSGSTSTAGVFTVDRPAPTLTGFTPQRGPVGTVVVLSGTNLTGALDVRTNQASARFTVTSATRVIATVPLGATTGRITVVTSGGSATSAASFIVVPAPVLSDFTPRSGRAGQTVTISGANLAGATSVKFNQTAAASFTVASGGFSIRAVVPAAATTGRISIATPGGTAVSTSSFTVFPPPILGSLESGDEVEEDQGDRGSP